jgi:hypothetical protein
MPEKEKELKRTTEPTQLKFEIHFIKFGSQLLLIAREKRGGVGLRRLAAKPSAFVHASL